MIKGCQRKIIMVKDTGSRFFECAYFVLKQDLPKNSRESDMIAQAHSIIDAYIPDGQPLGAPNVHKDAPSDGQKKLSPVLMGIISSVLSVSLTVAVMLILN